METRGRTGPGTEGIRANGTQAINRIHTGDCIEVLNTRVGEKSVDMVFADPPYNLRLGNELWRPNQTLVDAVNDDWDTFRTPEEYDRFTHDWLVACRRVLKDTGTIWVIGSYHNIFRVGKAMADLGFWTLNDIVWIKSNPMPNFNGTRFTNAHETMIWAKKSKDQRKYTFNYRTMKSLNDDLQMRSDWYLPLCTGEERVRVDGVKAHSTQKPEALLRRVIMASSNVGDVILDPFLGTGTTAVVAKRLRRNWIGIEKDVSYVDIATKRLSSVVEVDLDDELLSTSSRRTLPRVSIGTLLDVGLLREGERLFSEDGQIEAVLCADGQLVLGDERGSIHKIGAIARGQRACNGWDFWHVRKDGQPCLIDELRNDYRRQFIATSREGADGH